MTTHLIISWSDCITFRILNSLHSHVVSLRNCEQIFFLLRSITGIQLFSVLYCTYHISYSYKKIYLSKIPKIYFKLTSISSVQSQNCKISSHPVYIKTLYFQIPSLYTLNAQTGSNLSKTQNTSQTQSKRYFGQVQVTRFSVATTRCLEISMPVCCDYFWVQRHLADNIFSSMCCKSGKWIQLLDYQVIRSNRKQQGVVSIINTVADLRPFKSDTFILKLTYRMTSGFDNAE